MPSKPAARASSNFCFTLSLSAVAPRNELYMRPFFSFGRLRAAEVDVGAPDFSAPDTRWTAASVPVIAEVRKFRRFMLSVCCNPGRCETPARGRTAAVASQLHSKLHRMDLEGAFDAERPLHAVRVRRTAPGVPGRL